MIRTHDPSRQFTRDGGRHGGRTAVEEAPRTMPERERSTGPEDAFRCYSCGRWFKWKPEISGRTLRCTCGSKVRCPELHDDTITAGESLEDTVADVELSEALDAIETDDEPIEDQSAEAGVDVQELFAARRRHQGVFGLALGGEVLLYFGLSILGVAFAILAVILGKYFWIWIVAAVLTGPISWWRLVDRWRRWAAGRSFMVALADVFGLHDEKPSG